MENSNFSLHWEESLCYFLCIFTYIYIHIYICKYTSQFNNSKYKEYQGRCNYKVKTSFSGEKTLQKEYLWSSQMNLHLVGHNLQLSIKGTIILYVFKSDQWHHKYKMINQELHIHWCKKIAWEQNYILVNLNFIFPNLMFLAIFTSSKWYC